MATLNRCVNGEVANIVKPVGGHLTFMGSFRNGSVTACLKNSHAYIPLLGGHLPFTDIFLSYRRSLQRKRFTVVEKCTCPPTLTMKTHFLLHY